LRQVARTSLFHKTGTSACFFDVERFGMGRGPTTTG
jgi:hypothetical protein